MPLIRLANRFSSVIGLRHVTVVTYRRAGDDDSMERAGCFLACRLVDPFNSFSRRSRKPKVLFFNEFKSLLFFWRGIKLIETHEKLTYVVTSKSKATGRAAIPCSLAVNDAQPNITLDAQ